MKAVKINEASNVQLNYCVALAEGFKYIHASPAWTNAHGARGPAQVMVSHKKNECHDFCPTENWSQGGEIIEREFISVAAPLFPSTTPWQACIGAELPRFYEGPTPLIAAMRCYVASKLGGEVEVPANLI